MAESIWKVLASFLTVIEKEIHSLTSCKWIYSGPSSANWLLNSFDTNTTLDEHHLQSIAIQIQAIWPAIVIHLPNPETNKYSWHSILLLERGASYTTGVVFSSFPKTFEFSRMKRIESWFRQLQSPLQNPCQYHLIKLRHSGTVLHVAFRWWPVP